MASEFQEVQPTAYMEADITDQPGLAREKTSSGQCCLLQKLHRVSLGQLVKPPATADGRCLGHSKDGTPLSWAWKPHKNTKTQASSLKAEFFLTM